MFRRMYHPLLILLVIDSKSRLTPLQRVNDWFLGRKPPPSVEVGAGDKGAQIFCMLFVRLATQLRGWLISERGGGRLCGPHNSAKFRSWVLEHHKWKKKYR